MALALVFFTRSYGLYGPIQNRSGLHEQRMTMQATLTAGLLLCGALYVMGMDSISRVVVLLLVVLTGLLLGVRRAIWRRMEYSRFRQGLETRNVHDRGRGPCGACAAQSSWRACGTWASGSRDLWR